MSVEFLKTFFQKLKIIFVSDNKLNKWWLVLLFSISTIYSFISNLYILLIIPIFIIVFLFFKHKSLFIICILILSLTLPIIINRKIKFNNYSYGPVEGIAKVSSVTSKPDYDKVIIKINNKKFIYSDKSRNFSSGDKIYVKGETFKVSQSHFDKGFNYYNYLQNNNIYGTIKISHYEKKTHSFNINIIHEKITKYISNNYPYPSNTLLLALVVGEKSEMSSELTENIQKIGIGHLFVVSGLHLQIIGGILYFFLNKTKLKDNVKDIIVFVIFLIYFVISAFMVSILRVILSHVLSKMLKGKIINTSSIDKLIISSIIVLSINPFYLFNYSFLLSYSIVLIILVVSIYFKKEKGIKNYLLNSLIISISGLFMSLPIVSLLNGKINILQICFNLIFIPFVSYIMLPLSLITIVIKPLHYIYNPMSKAFIYVVEKLSKIDFLTIKFPKISLFGAIIYYLIFFMFFIFKNKKVKILTVITLMIFIICWNNKIIFNTNSFIRFIDLPSGDSTLIMDKHNKCNILIDTGDDNDTLVSDLISIGIKRIDIVFITHSDSDHIGGLNRLIKEFKINNIAISSYDFKSKEKIEPIKKRKTNIVSLNCGDTFVYKNVMFNIISPKNDFNDVNNNSLVMEVKFKNLDLLFCGDIEKKAEDEIIKEIKGNHYDVLKVAHHGSNTSSSENFMKNINVNLAIAMNGYNNKYGFPSNITIENYKNWNIPLLNTIDYGTITIKINNKKVKIINSFNP